MTLAIYIKAPPTQLKPKKDFQNFQWPKIKSNKKRDRFFFAAISVIGLMSIFFALWPFVIWQIHTVPRFSKSSNKTPIPEGQVLPAKAIGYSNVQVVQDSDGFSYFIPTNFSKDLSVSGQETRPQEFFVTIPKLKIEKAKVKVDSLRFDNNLALFPQTPLPGEVGNSFITGHSVLPQFNDPENYRAIFTKLSDLEIGDDVYVEINDQKLHFAVQYLKIIDPHDLSVLAPISQDGHNLTLMTCVPPGTNLKRLVVITSLM